MALFLQYREFKGGGCSKPPLTFRNVASGFKSFFSFSLEPKKPDFPDVSSDSFKLFWSVWFLSSSYISTTHRVGFIQQVIPKKNGRNKHFSEFSIFNKLQLVPAHFYYYGKNTFVCWLPMQTVIFCQWLNALSALTTPVPAERFLSLFLDKAVALMDNRKHFSSVFTSCRLR